MWTAGDEAEALRAMVANALEMEPERVVITKYVLVTEIEVDDLTIGQFSTRGAVERPLLDWEELGLLEWQKVKLLEQKFDGYEVSSATGDRDSYGEKVDETLRRARHDNEG